MLFLEITLCLGILYIPLFLSSALQLILQIYADKSVSRIQRIWIFILIGLSSMLRDGSFWFNYEQVLALHPVEYSYRISILLESLPSIFLFSTYLLMAMNWAEIYHQSAGATSPQEEHINDIRANLRRTTVFLNVSAYLCYFVFYVLQFALEMDEKALVFIASYNAVLALGIAGVYLFYGRSLFLTLSKFRIASKTRLMQMKKIALLTSLSILCFVTRGFVIFWTNIMETNISAEQQDFFFLFYYVLLDAVPTFFILILFWTNPLRSASCVPSINDGVDESGVVSPLVKSPGHVGGSVGVDKSYQALGGQSATPPVRPPPVFYTYKPIPFSGPRKSIMDLIENGPPISRNETAPTLIGGSFNGVLETGSMPSQSVPTRIDRGVSSQPGMESYTKSIRSSAQL